MFFGVIELLVALLLTLIPFLPPCSVYRLEWQSDLNSDHELFSQGVAAYSGVHLGWLTLWRPVVPHVAVENLYNW